MSNIYWENNRIIKMKDVDNQLNKIGTWRENISPKALTALILSILLLLGVCGGIQYNKHHKQKIKNNPVKMTMYDVAQHKSR